MNNPLQGAVALGAYRINSRIEIDTKASSIVGSKGNRTMIGFHFKTLVLYNCLPIGTVNIAGDNIGSSQCDKTSYEGYRQPQLGPGFSLCNSPRWAGNFGL